MKHAVLLLFLVAAVHSWGQPKDAVDLANVQSLTFMPGRMTKGRRSAPIPQMRCVSGSACSEFERSVEAVQCRNMGTDDAGNVQWKCEADLDEAVRFSHIDVSCEGYSSRQDTLKLKGSCGLEYGLEYTPKARNSKKRQHQPRGGAWQGRETRQAYHPEAEAYRRKSNAGTTELSPAYVFFGIVCTILAISYCMTRQAEATGRTTGRSGGGGGGGGPFHGGSGGGGGSGSGADDYDSCSRPSRHVPPSSSSFTSSSGGGPGFFSGAAMGGALGYLFGRGRQGTHYNTPYNHGPNFRHRYNQGPFTQQYYGDDQTMFDQQTPDWGQGNYNMGWGGQPTSSWDNGNDDEGPSATGITRRAAGYGGTSTR